MIALRFVGSAVSPSRSRRRSAPPLFAFAGGLVAHGLDKPLFEAITGQLKARAIQVKTDTLVDATIIASASEDDGEGHWVKHRGRPQASG